MKKHLYILILILFNSVIAWTQTYSLEYDLKQGDQYFTEFLSEITINQTVMGIEQEIGMKMEADFSQLVNKILPDSHYELMTEYTGLYMQISSTFFSVEIDTDSKIQDDLLNNMMRRILNKPLNLVISKKGELKEISGIESLMNGLFEGSEIDENQMEHIRQLLQKNMGEESLRQNFSQFFCNYPEKQVRLGETWKVNYQIEQAEIAFGFSGTGKLVEATPRTFLVRIEGKLNTTHLMDNADKEQSFLMDGSLVSEFTIDRKTGWPLKSTTNQEISGLLVINTPGEETDTIQIPMQMKMRMNIKSK